MACAELASWTLDLSTGAVEVDASYASFLGYEPAALQGLDLHRMHAWLHPDDRILVAKRLADFLQGRVRRYEMEFRLRDAKGDWRWFLEKGLVLERNAAGGVSRLLVTVSDVTPRRQRDQLASQLTHRLIQQNDILGRISVLPEVGRGDVSGMAANLTELVGTLLRVDEVSVWLLDESEHHFECIDTYCFAAAVRSPRGGMPHSFFQAQFADLERIHFVERQYADAAPAPCSGGFPTKGVRSLLCGAVRVAGRCVGLVAFQYFEAAHRWKSDEIGFVCQLADQVGMALLNRQRLRTESMLQGTLTELARANQRLEEAHRVAQDSASRADSANSAKGQFLANMSHEIRTPINGIMGMTDMLLDTPLNDSQVHFARTVRSSCEALLGVINDILDFSKIEAGKIELEHIEFDLWALVDDLGDMLAPKAAEKNLRFHLRLDPQLPRLLVGDPTRLRQILINLLNNALKFTSRGGVTLDVRATRESSRWRLQASVRDTGIGLSPEGIQHLFQPFTQADTTHTRKFGGTGLGLAITRQLVRLMGGDIEVQSEQGRGACFGFTALFGEAPAPAMQSLAGNRILVASADLPYRECLEEHLKVLGAAVEGLADGQAVIERARQGELELLLLDSDLLEVDVGTVGRALKADPRVGSLRIVYTCPANMLPSAEWLTRQGFSTALSRPVRFSELGTRLHRALTQARASKQPLVSTPRAGVQVPRQTWPQVRILLAEDNDINREVATSLLTRMGFSSLTTVCNGAEAVRALSTKDFDIVLMDVQMPVLDGLAATALIRQSDSPVRQHAIPIVAMTAHAMKGDREKCLEAGMSDYLSKPIMPDVLKAILHKWCAARMQAPADAAPAPSHAAGTSSETSVCQVFNEAALLKRLMGDPELAAQILDRFLQDAHSIFEAYREASQAGDAVKLNAQAHKLKGTASTLGAERLAEVCLRVEMLAKNGSLREASSLLPRVSAAFDELLQALHSRNAKGH